MKLTFENLESMKVGDMKLGEFFIINETIYLFTTDVPIEVKPICLWNRYAYENSKYYNQNLRDMIISLKTNVLIDYGIHIYGPKFREQYLENKESIYVHLNNTPEHELLMKIIGKHTSYTDVVQECMELIRTYQETTNINYMSEYINDKSGKKETKKSSMIIIS